jgi:hypothetical protein
MRVKSSYRITKYNPQLRDERGAYLNDEWTSASDVGKQFPAGKLQLSDYLSTENAYVDSAVALWRLAQGPALRVTSLEGNIEHAKRLKLPSVLNDILEQSMPTDGQMLADVETIARVVRLILRELIWCRLQSDSGFFLHFGYDYYMYCGGVKLDTESHEAITKMGLFVEKFVSPYLIDE